MNEYQAEVAAESTVLDLYDAFTHYLDKGLYAKAREVIAQTIRAEFYGEAKIMQGQLDAKTI